MPDVTAVSGASVLDAETQKLLQRARSGSVAGATEGKASGPIPPGVLGLQGPSLDEKIEKSSKDFESILLGSWLQKAEESFATVPGGDGDDDDSGKDQFQGIAMQALAGSLTKSGGIGIAKMIAEHLHAAAAKEAEPAKTKGLPSRHPVENLSKR